VSGKEIFKVYGISQNPDTTNYILVLNWLSGNEKLDDFIQRIQLGIKDNENTEFELISYDQFSEIKKIGKGGFSTIYTAIWKNKTVVLKCLDNSQNHINELLNEV
jgi:hypothetical protein